MKACRIPGPHQPPMFHSHIHVHAEIYIYTLDTYRRNEQQTQEDFFINIYTSHFICKGTKGLLKGLHVRGSWRPNITEIF